MFVDSHAHLDVEDFDADREEAIARARAAGIRWILTIGTGDPKNDSLARAVKLAEKHSDVLAAAGVHPHDASLFDDQVEANLAQLLTSSRKVVALGEIGLDYHYDHSPRAVQQAAFKEQLRLARAADLPVIIHSREADDDTMQILENEAGSSSDSGHSSSSNRAGVMHCFGGDLGMLERAVAISFMISFAGNVTFRKAEALRQVARRVPLDRLLIETDCPFLAPIPYRGRRNEPAYVVEVAKCLADLHGTTTEEIGRLTSANFARFFKLTLAS